ncbi:MAG: VRR-NUC domain-containing protein [Gammaproteobacteria bacterium]
MIARFRALPEPARCLFVRLANRRRSLFRSSRLNYPEIPALSQALTVLEAADLVTRQTEQLLTDQLGWLDAFTRTELLQLFSDQVISRRLSKAELLEHIPRHFDSSHIVQTLTDYDPVLLLTVVPELQVLKFLFFGSLNRDMEQFVLRDLGQVQFETLDTHLVPAYFLNRQHVQDCLAVRQAYQQFLLLSERLPAAALAQWFETWQQQHQKLHPDAERVLARLTVRVGQVLERAGLITAALACYAQCELPPARERRIRLLQRSQRSAEALALCETILASPGHGGERIFAEDFRNAIRAGQTRRAVTRYLKTAPQLVLPDALQKRLPRVEQAVLRHFQERGWQGHFAENLPWRALLGLLLWDVLFDARRGGFMNPLQRGPTDLWSPDFYLQHQQGIDQILSSWCTQKQRWPCLEQKMRAKWGIANPLVVWVPELPELLRQLVIRLQGAQLQAILQDILSNVRDQAHGFPDLMLWRDDEYQLLEVKSPTDRLSDQQLYWLCRFEQLDICAGIIRIKWAATAEKGEGMLLSDTKETGENQ